jgi:mannosyltransferase
MPTYPQPSPIRTTLLILGMMAIPCVLSVLFFMGQSLRLDEAQSLWQTSRAPFDTIRLIAGDVHVPFYHLILHYWRLFLGDTVEGARMLSLGFFLVAIPATYFLGKRAYSRSVGLFAAFLLSISPFMNWYGNEIRMYTLFSLLVIVNQICFIAIFKDHSRNAWWGYAITALLGIYTHYFFFLNLLSQAVFFLVKPRIFPRGTFVRLLTIAVVVVLAFAPWVYAVVTLGIASNQDPLLSPPTAVNLFNTFAQFLFGFQEDNVNTIFLSLWPVALIFAFIALRTKQKPLPVTIYLIITILVSILVAFVISTTLRPVFLSRYLSFTIPSLYILLASHLDGYAPRYRAIFKTLLALLMLGTLVVQVWSAGTPVKENYREASAYLTQEAGPQDVIVLSAPFTVYPVEYYYRGTAPIETLPLWDRTQFGAIPPFSEAELPLQVETLTQDHRTLWLLLSYDQGYESAIRLYFDTNFERLEQRQFSPGLTLSKYKLNYDEPFAELSE